MHEEVLQHYDIMTVGEGPGISRDLAAFYVGEDRKELNMIFHFGHMFIDHGDGGRFDVIDKSFLDFKKVFSDWIKSLMKVVGSISLWTIMISTDGISLGE